MDIYKYEMRNQKQANKAARRLVAKQAKFRMLDTAIVVLAQGNTRKNITTVMTNLGVFTSPATQYDVDKLMNQ
jgi:hypothetical protein